MNRGVSVESKRQDFNALRSFYTFMHSNKLIDTDPTEELPPIKRGRKHQAPAQTIKVMQGLEQADTDTKLMIQLAVELGLRRHEIACIRLPDDMVEDLLGWSLIVHGKGNKDRIIPLTISLADTLLKRDKGWLFPSKYDYNKHICDDTVYRHIKDTVGEPTHSLRRKFATDLYRATGGNLRVVQESLGHESLTTTQLYISVTTDDIREGINKLEKFRRQQHLNIH